MLGPLGHLASGFAYALRRNARRRADAAAIADAAWARSPRAADLPAGLALEWLGTAGFRLSYAGFDLLIDPYFTRATFGALARGAVAPDPASVARAPRASAILVGHTHFDHALDVPALARATGAPVYGGASLAHLMGLHGEAARAVVVEPHRPYEVGPFRFHFVPSRHSKLALGLWTPADGELSCEHLDDLTARAYRCGQVWGIHVAVAGVTFYHQGSCDLVDDEITDRGVDYFLAGIAGRRFTPRYLPRIVRRLDPRVIVPHHWDDFFRPVDAPVGFSLNVDVAGFLDEVAAVSRDLEVRVLSPLAPVIGR